MKRSSHGSQYLYLSTLEAVPNGEALSICFMKAKRPLCFPFYLWVGLVGKLPHPIKVKSVPADFEFVLLPHNFKWKGIHFRGLRGHNHNSKEIPRCVYNHHKFKKDGFKRKVFPSFPTFPFDKWLTAVLCCHRQGSRTYFSCYSKHHLSKPGERTWVSAQHLARFLELLKVEDKRKAPLILSMNAC